MGSAEVQGPLWGVSANDWAEIVEPDQIPYYEAALDAIEVRSGMRLLDVGCGSGLAMELAHKRGTTVSGLDAAEGLLAVARDRLPGADLRHGDVEALPYEDETFDAVTAFNSVQYATDPTAALREVKRVSRSRAPVAIATWGPVEQCEMRVVLGAIGSLLPPPPPGPAGRSHSRRLAPWRRWSRAPDSTLSKSSTFRPPSSTPTWTRPFGAISPLVQAAWQSTAPEKRPQGTRWSTPWTRSPSRTDPYSLTTSSRS